MTAPDAARLLVADSFRVRVRDGEAEARGIWQHVARFSWSVMRATGGTLPAVGNFIDTARDQIASFGAGNPRLELWSVPGGRHELRLSLRPLPELRRTIELRSVSPVPLEHPERKGMNIERFAALNRAAGAEAVLTDPHGSAIEGTTTALLWWEGDALCSVAATARVASVTEALLLALAEGLGVETRTGTASPRELAGREVWAVNALHGLRPVTSVDGVPAPTPDGARLERFLRALDTTWEPVRVPEA
ncbi:aminotransferase class IV [Leucobacter albus]|uniref:Aminotransferase class IV n=1 Tax=Leucobacter albus TaxID=272210 RepID=A0ABW3TJU8_9MICO